MFATLRRWAHGAIPEGKVPVAATLMAMDQGGSRRV